LKKTPETPHYASHFPFYLTTVSTKSPQVSAELVILLTVIVS